MADHKAGGGPSASPTFYLLDSVSGTPTLYRLRGPLNANATLTAIGTGLSSPALIAANPQNPLSVFAVDLGFPAGIRKSTNGGASFVTDTA